MSWRWPERVGSTLIKLGVVGLLAAAAADGTSRASAQVGSGDATGGEVPPPPDEDDDFEAPFHPPFTQYPDDPGALQFDDLTPAQQEAVMHMAERTDYGPEIHGDWSTITHRAAAAAKVQRAAYQAGMTGLEMVGVP